jgi:phosphate:Na+ symporter
MDMSPVQSLVVMTASDNDPAPLAKLARLEKRVDRLQQEEKVYLARLGSQARSSATSAAPSRCWTTSSISNMLHDLKRITAHLISVTHPILDEEGILVESRLKDTADA